MNSRFILFLILGVDALILLFQTDKLSITYDEASLLYGNFSVLGQIVKISLTLFGQNDFALRLPMITIHLLSVLLLYQISNRYIKLEKNRIYLVLFFVLLPGIISSAIVVNSAGLLIFCLLLFVYIYQNYNIRYSYFLLFIYSFIEANFVFLYISLLIYALYKRDRNFFIFNLFLFVFSLYVYGINTHGSPKGYFLDSIGLYTAIFTPIVFIYMVYALYRKFLVKEIDIIWFISTISLCVSLLLSFRQRIGVEYFATYLVLALPLMAQIFEHSYRVRLKMFRKNYKFMFVVALIFLIVNSLVVFFNEYFYIFIKEPKKHFAYKMHVAKPLANKLKQHGVYCVDTDERMQKRLLFYGVTKCNTYKLSPKSDTNQNQLNVTIGYKNKQLYSAYVTKINKN